MTDRTRSVRRRGESMEPQSLKPQRQIKRITPLIDKLLDAVADGSTPREAAETLGVQLRFVQKALSAPVVRKEYERRIEEVRTAERAGNIHAALRVRDVVNTREKWTAAESTAALKAAQWLHGEPANGQNAGVNVHINVNPGYVIDLSAGQPLTQRQVIDHKPLKSHDELTGDAR